MEHEDVWSALLGHARSMRLRLQLRLQWRIMCLSSQLGVYHIYCRRCYDISSSIVTFGQKHTQYEPQSPSIMMKSTIICVLVASVLALPNHGDQIVPRQAQYHPCTSGFYSSAQYCSTDVLGILGLDCTPRKYWKWSETNILNKIS